MALVRSESRSRVGIDWYDNEAEADEAGRRAQASPAAADANIGVVQVGRATGYDQPGEYAVVTP